MFSLRSLSNTALSGCLNSVKQISFAKSTNYKAALFSYPYGVQQRFFAEKVNAIDLKKGDIISRKGGVPTITPNARSFL